MRVALANRITPQDLADYLKRRISAKEVARIYDTKATYVIKALPKRPPRPPEIKKSELVQARREYRDHLALQVIHGRLTIKEAADQARCTVRTMFRRQKKVRECLKTSPSTTMNVETTNQNEHHSPTSMQETSTSIVNC